MDGEGASVDGEGRRVVRYGVSIQSGLVYRVLMIMETGRLVVWFRSIRV